MVNALLRAGATLDAPTVDLIIEFLPKLEKVSVIAAEASTSCIVVVVVVVFGFALVVPPVAQVKVWLSLASVVCSMLPLHVCAFGVRLAGVERPTPQAGHKETA